MQISSTYFRTKITRWSCNRNKKFKKNTRKFWETIISTSLVRQFTRMDNFWTFVRSLVVNVLFFFLSCKSGPDNNGKKKNYPTWGCPSEVIECAYIHTFWLFIFTYIDYALRYQNISYVGRPTSLQFPIIRTNFTTKHDYYNYNKVFKRD